MNSHDKHQSATALQPSCTWFGPQNPPYKHETPIALVGGTLIDATGAPAKPNHSVLIDGGKIIAVAADADIVIPPDARQFDCRGMTIMPGLINSNQHIQLNPLYMSVAAELSMVELRARWENNYSNMEKNAFVCLMQGVTTIRQTSGPRDRLLPMKARIEAGEIAGPRIELGGALIMSPQHFKTYIKESGTPADAVDWLRNEFAYFIVEDIEKDLAPLMGPEFSYWKLYLSHHIFDGKNDFTDEELHKIIDMAHSLGKKIDVHANNTPEGFERLLNFKIDTLQHPFEDHFLIDEKTIEGFARNNVFAATLLRVRVTAVDHAEDPNRFNATDFVMGSTPADYRTLMNYRDRMLYNLRNPDQPGVPIFVKRNADGDEVPQPSLSFNEQLKRREMTRENMRRFIKGGVKFFMGTDSTSALNFLQDEPNALEMQYMVELGMTPMESIIASTRNGAEALGKEASLGTIEIGKIADVIVVNGDPLADMRAMKNVAVVIKDGIRYK